MVLSVSATRSQEQVGDDLIVTGVVFKSITTLSGMKMGAYAKRMVDGGGDKTKNVGMLIDERFVAFTRGLEAMVALNSSGGAATRRAGDFRFQSKNLPTTSTMCKSDTSFSE